MKMSDPPNEKPPERDSRGYWRPGVSGNPQGRKKGARHPVTILAERMLQSDAEDVVRAVIKAAKEGDMAAAKLVLERICPVRKGAPVVFDIPELMTAADLPQAVAAVTREVAEGTLSPDEGASVVSVLDMQRRAIETADLAHRVAVLEEKGE
jgi:Family of unknown function (DUF5681)